MRRSKAAKGWGLALAGLVLAGLGISRADEVLLKDGRRLKGKVTVIGDVCTVEQKYGSQEVSMADVIEIIRDAEGGAEDSGEKAGADEETPPGEATQSEDATPEEIELESPTPEELGALRNDAGAGSFLEETRHFVIASTAPRDFTKERGKLLERVRSGFYRFFGKKGFALDRHPKKLEAVIFKDAASFSAFCRSNGFGGMSKAAGFYTSSTNRLYFYDARNTRDAQRIREELAKFETNIDDAKKKRREAERAKNHAYAKSLSKWIKDAKRRLRKFKRDNAKFLDEANDEVTVHEATHQLCYNSNLLIPSELNPPWLVEGLAMLFEDRGVWMGRYVKDANETRIGALARARGEGQSIALADLIDARTPLLGRRHPHLAYAMSWALTHMFVRGKFRKYKDRFFDYLKAVREQSEAHTRGAEARDARLEMFGEAFGDVDGLDRELEAYIKKLVSKHGKDD